MIPTREEPTPFVIDGRLNTLGAIEEYFATVRRMFPVEFGATAKRYFYEFDDPTKSLKGLYDANSGRQLDKGAPYEYQWTFEQYCQNVVGRSGYQLVTQRDLVRFLRAYWGFRNFQSDRGLAAVSIDVACYYAMTMGAALQSLAAVKGDQKGRAIEDWIV